MKVDRKIVLDTETTGLDYLIKDKIIEIAAVELLDNKTIGKEFHSFINPEMKIDESGIKIHGITDEIVKDKPTFREIYKDFLNFIGDSKIIAHNAEFDRNFLNLELYLIGEEVLSRAKFIDSLSLVRILFKGEKHSLDELCIKFNIELSSRKERHGALIDAKLLAKVYIEIMTIVNNSPNFKNTYVNKIINKDIIPIIFKKQNFPYRNFQLKENEIKDHINFLKKIKNYIWKF